MPCELDHKLRRLLTRRKFLRTLLAMASAPLASTGLLLGRARRAREQPERVRLPVPTSDGVTFHREVILVRAQGELRALSARCPHLGCRVGRVEGEVLVCPCHGSRFDVAGRVLGGPSTADLQQLAVEPLPGEARIDVVFSR